MPDLSVSPHVVNDPSVSPAEPGRSPTPKRQLRDGSGACRRFGPVKERPEVHDTVVLRDGAGQEHASRVEKLGEGLVVVTQPADLPDDTALPHGTELRVAWSQSDDVVTVLPTRILAAHAEGPLRLWSLIVTGPAVNEQRRRVERTEVTGPVLLRSVEGGEAVSAALLDISEKAVRCSVRTGSADRFLSDRNEVVAEFSIGTVDFVIPGRVEFARATKQPTQLEEVVVLFDEPVAEVDALRTQLFTGEVPSTTVADQGGA